jgi:transcriptional regulator
MKIVVLEGDEAKAYLNELVNRVGDNVLEKIEKRFKNPLNKSDKEKELWVSSVQAKQILGVKSNKKMQSLRDQDLIKFSQYGRTIRYHTASLYEFLENHVVKG